MATRLDAVVMDATDPGRAGRFWAAALGWSVLDEQAGTATVGVAGADRWGDGGPVTLRFVATTEPKTAKNRVHLDLAAGSLAEQRAIVDRLRGLGARHVDIGQEEAPWAVMADPEGNELCVLDPRVAYHDVGPLGAVLVDCADPIELANFWMKASGWPALRHSEGYAALRHPRTPTTWLELLEVPDPAAGTSRVRVEVVTAGGGDLDAEVARLQRAGGRRLPAGRCGGGAVALADPQATVLCVREAPYRPT